MAHFLPSALWPRNLQFSTYFYKIVPEAVLVEQFGDFVDGVTLGPARQVYVHCAMALAHCGLVAARLQALVANVCHRLLDQRVVRWLAYLAIGPESPEIHERADGDIESTIAQPADLQRAVDGVA